MGVTQEAFLEAFGDAAYDLVLEHKAQMARRVEEQREAGQGTGSEFRIMRSPDDPKTRWVDGTPEYSHHIVGIRALFPKAKFIHLVRDAPSAVLSMVNFHKVGGPRWSRERALGSDVVQRLRYKDMIEDPESALRRCLDFLGEPYFADCVKPLETRINSSYPEEATEDGGDVDAELEQAALLLSESALADEGTLPPDADRTRELERRYRAGLVGYERLYANNVDQLVRRAARS
jgi:hypothetical protein